jgi:hypothetical protein
VLSYLMPSRAMDRRHLYSQVLRINSPLTYLALNLGGNGYMGYWMVGWMEEFMGCGGSGVCCGLASSELPDR